MNPDREVNIVSDQDMRRAFEKFYLHENARLYTNLDVTPEILQRIVLRDHAGQYAMPDVERCWQSWRAGEMWLLRPR